MVTAGGRLTDWVSLGVLAVPGSGGITRPRQRLGYEPLKALLTEVAAPVAEELTAGAFLGPWRMMAIDGFEWDAPDTKENAAAFGFAGTGADDPGRPAYPKVGVVTVSECTSHAVADAAMGAVAGKGAGDQSLAPQALPAAGRGLAVRILATVMADTARSKHLSPRRRRRTYPRVIKRARHNSYRVKRPGDHGTRHTGPATIKLVSLHLPALAA